MTGPRTELYVYYRVARPDGPAALQAVLELQRSLRQQHAGLAARVLQRSAEDGDTVTLMEIYAFDDGKRAGVGPALQARIEEAAAAMGALLASPRQIETFDALD
jgi:GNAT superfamily N-acetyltransferase